MFNFCDVINLKLSSHPPWSQQNSKWEWTLQECLFHHLTFNKAIFLTKGERPLVSLGLFCLYNKFYTPKWGIINGLHKIVTVQVQKHEANQSWKYPTNTPIFFFPIHVLHFLWYCLTLHLKLDLILTHTPFKTMTKFPLTSVAEALSARSKLWLM